MSIIPNPGSPPTVAPIGEPITTNGGVTTTIAAGTQVYGNVINVILRGFHDTLINHGTIWLDSPTEQGWLMTGGESQLENSGFIYIRGGIQAELSPSITRFVNSGSVFVTSNSGWARGVRSETYPADIDNSGLIAVQSLGTDPQYESIWNATGIEIVSTTNGIINRAGGRILVEAPNLAIGIDYGGSDFLTGASITNAGLIHANATAQDGVSIGIFMAHPGYMPRIVVNEGTIRADIAIYASGSAQSVLNPVEQIENRASGVIEGRVFLDLGDDGFVNNGTVIGDVLMGAGEDVFEGSGSVSGVVDMGFDDDRYTGSNANDRATGGRGGDVMEGGGGNDLLLGAFGNDVLRGGAGNDGLIGEWGNDVIHSAGGDHIEGGTGSDRVVLGDLTFRFAGGGGGYDTLVLPDAALMLDLASVIASGRVVQFEAIELPGAQQVVVRAGDADALSDSTVLRFEAGASGTVTLVGGWSEQPVAVIGGNSYRIFTLGGETVQVRQGASVAITATAPANAVGLDAIAGGTAAPTPGEAAGLAYTAQAQFLSQYYIPEDRFTIDSEEIFFSDGAPVFLSDRAITFTNFGEIYSLDDAFPSAQGLRLTGPADLVNHGIIAVEELADRNAEGIFYYPSIAVAMGGGPDNTNLTNSGEISVYSRPGSAIAVHNVGAVLNNSGVIAAVSEFSRAIAVNAARGSHILTEAQTFFNTGLIYAEAGGTGQQNFTEGDFLVPVDYAATGVAAYGSLTNAGDIIAAIGPNGSAGLVTVGVYLLYPYGPATRYGVTNSGLIEGTIAIAFAAAPVPVSNFVVNTGVIDGHIEFGAGNDDYDGRSGELRGTAFGFGGDDRLTGGRTADRLDGGDGDDVLDGGLGADQLVGGAGNDRFYVDRQDDLVFEDAGGGTDTVISTGSFYLYANIENLTLAGSGDTFGVGNELGNTLLGNGGSNLLIAGAGDDVVRGGGGVDSLFGQDGSDQLFGDAGIDYLVGGAGNDVLDGGIDADALYGEEGDDVLIGGSSFSTDILVGGAGNDVLRGDSGLGDYDLMDGGSGDDSYYVDTPDDLTFEAANGGTDTVYATINGAGYYLYAHTENLVLGGDTPFGVGNELNNRLTGSAASNWLLGGAGNDMLNGRGGNDVLFGESGADIFVFERGTGADVIGDFVAGTDRIDLSAFGFTSFAQVQAALGENGGTAFLTLGNGDMVVLNGVAGASLSAGDFILASAGDGKVPVMEAIDVDRRPDLIHAFVNPRLFVDLVTL